MNPDLDQLALDTTEQIMELGASDKPASQLKATVQNYIRDALGLAALRVKVQAQEIYAEREATAAAAAPAASSSAAPSDLQTALTVFDMGLSFALCHKDFGATREAVKKLQADFDAIQAMLAAPAASLAVLTDAERLALVTSVLNHVVGVVSSFGDVSCAAYLSTWHKPDTVLRHITGQAGGEQSV